MRCEYLLGSRTVNGKSLWCGRTLLVSVHGGVTSSLALAAYYFSCASFHPPLTPKDPAKAIKSV